MRTTITHTFAPGVQPQGITVQSTRRHDLVVLAVEGEIDLLTTPQLEEAVTAALADSPRGLIIDLTKTAFLSSAGMGALVAAHANAPAGRFGVVADGPSTSRPMELIGLDRALGLYASLETALSACTEVLEVSA